MRAIILAGFLACNTSTHKAIEADTQERKQEEVQVQAQHREDEVKTQGPVHEETETDRNEVALQVEEPDGEVVIARVTRKPLRFPKGSKVTATVSLGGSTTKGQKDTGPSVDTKSAQDNLAKADKIDDSKTGKIKAKEDDKTSVGLGYKFWLAILTVVLALAALALWFIKRRAKALIP